MCGGSVALRVTCAMSSWWHAPPYTSGRRKTNWLPRWPPWCVAPATRVPVPSVCNGAHRIGCGAMTTVVPPTPTNYDCDDCRAGGEAAVAHVDGRADVAAASGIAPTRCVNVGSGTADTARSVAVHACNDDDDGGGGRATVATTAASNCSFSGTIAGSHHGAHANSAPPNSWSVLGRRL